VSNLDKPVNNKSQITNYKKYPMTKITNSKLRGLNPISGHTENVLVIEYWILRFICDLVLVI
jgi:hypothetical protein